MYSALQNVQILIALLKKYHVSHAVLCPGGSDYAIVRSLESDGDFTCYSVVDESSAPYIAMGISKECNGIPVALVCTSGTASSNFVAGIRKAKQDGIPLIAITADRDPYLLNQMETQKVDQIGIFSELGKYNVSLPHVRSDREFAYCERIINDVLTAADQLKCPVHINVPTTLGASGCIVEKLPEVRKIDVLKKTDFTDKIFHKIQSCKKILILAGQSKGYSSETTEKMQKISRICSAVFCVDHLSNLQFDHTIHYYRITETISGKGFDRLCPDLVISFGNNFAGERIKGLLRSRHRKIEHWTIDEEGKIRDVFYAITKVFQMSVDEFFEILQSGLSEIHAEPCEQEYYRLWKNEESKIVINKIPFSNFLVAKMLADIVPENSIVHTSILNATRQTQFFNFKSGVKVYSNVGALGIDGCASTYFGQAGKDTFSFLLIGDLSFFYDLSSVFFDPISSNIRIVLVNNHAGGEFHYTTSNLGEYDIDRYVAAGHNADVKELVEALGFCYYSAYNEKELSMVMPLLAEESPAPVLLEVFTNADVDADVTRAIFEQFSSDTKKRQMVRRIRKTANSLLGEKRVAKLYRAVKKIH